MDSQHGQSTSVEDDDFRSNRAGERFSLGEFSIDEYRPIKVIVIGAGFSGIIAGIRLAQKIPNIDLTIYEKNNGIGGTWYSNRYPGVACDVPSHSYQLAFEENPNWSTYYAPGSEILAYMQRVVEKYKLMKYIKLNHELIHAKYDEPRGKWNIRIRRPGTDSEPEEFEDTADILLACTGCLSRWKWPDIPGLNDFKGRLVHSANWDIGEGSWEDGVKDWGDKRVGIIGVGSSAIQIVPAIQPKVAHLDTFVRNKTWLSPTFLSDILAKFTNKDAGNYKFTDEDKRAFADPEHYKEFRHQMEQRMNSNHQLTLKGSPLQVETRKALVEDMTKQLAKRPWIAEHLIPDFPVACRRTTPGPGFLAALCEDNVDFITSSITRVTSGGIELSNGEHRPLDVLVCATGYDPSYLYPFPVIGRGGTTLQSKWQPHPRTYLSLCIDEFPNLFFAFGPNSGLGTAALLILFEKQVDYIIQAILKIQRERLKSIEVKKAAVDDFDEYLEHYFKKTVFGENCSSWYKVRKEDGSMRIIGLWPGSSLHALRTFAHPKWEDFDYEYFDSNRSFWLGDGQTLNEKTMSGDRAWYLDDIDVPPVPAT